MTNWDELIRNEADPVRRAHFRRMKDGPEALTKLTEKDTTKQEERRKIVEEVARIGRENRKALNQEKIDLGTDSGDGFSDEQLRAAIEAATGKAPHHKTGRAKLVETFNALNAEA